MAPGAALFLQPHYDDVALSCGATVARYARAGCAPALVTVFASEVVHAMVGDFAAWKHARWQLHDVDAVVDTRRREDAAAAQVLGATLRWLGLPDAIYRVGRYRSDAELYGPLREEEKALASHLAQELKHLPEWREGNQVFVPLGVGSHVDHQLVFEAGRCLAAFGVQVWAYEDLPYGIHSPEALDARLAQVGAAVGPAIHLPAEETLLAKLEAVACYASQLPVIFRFTSDYREALRVHAQSTGGGVPAERFWPVAAPAALSSSPP